MNYFIVLSYSINLFIDLELFVGIVFSLGFKGFKLTNTLNNPHPYPKVPNIIRDIKYIKKK